MTGALGRVHLGRAQYLDDLILLPGLIWVTVRLLPKQYWMSRELRLMSGSQNVA